MLGVPGLLLGANTAAEGGATVGDVGIVGTSSGGFSEDERGRGGAGEEGDRSSAGNRWPRQETLALLKIRCDMDVAFRDSTLKGPLWDEISRKMAELGFVRSAKKCKEKFENVYKYHKRTKEGRASKADGKTYRFYQQLEALETTYASPSQPPQLQLPAPPPQLPAPTFPQITVPSVTAANFNAPSQPITPIPTPNPFQNPQQQPPQQQQQPDPLRQQHQVHQVLQAGRPNYHPSSNSTSSSSSTSSDETPPGERRGGRRKRKRKWKDYFERLMRDVVGRQEELQRKFLEAIERRERERMAREESWRAQEMARMNKEHEILVQERAGAAAKEAALISFLQRMTSSSTSSEQLQQHHQQQQQQTPTPVQFPSSTELTPQPPQSQHQQQLVPAMMIENTASSRWPKAEVEALIRLRTEMDVKYQESGPKGPLWEEISLGMNHLGYERNSKRCKEKWENINKYFKKVKESSKKRPEDSKTCPYFHQLDALYRDKSRIMMIQTSSATTMLPAPAGISYGSEMPLMVRPEQQWPHPNPNPDMEQDNIPDEEDDEDDDDEDEESGGGGYEIVTSKQLQ